MTDADPAAAFDALGDETRVAILRALVECRHEDPFDPTVSFSDLRKHVGASDSGRFNYHLGKLRDRFVEKTDDGYRLTAAGEQMVTAVLSGAVADDVAVGPEPLGHDCPFCETPVSGQYEDGHVAVVCENDHHLLHAPAPPTLVRDRDLDTVLSATVLDSYHAISLAKRGVCQSCYGHVEPTVRERESALDDAYGFVGTCERCGEHYSSPLAVTLLDHPALQGFLWEHDRDPTESYPWLFGFLSPENVPEVVSTDPLRLRVTVDVDGDAFVAVVDDRAQVLETRVP